MEDKDLIVIDLGDLIPDEEELTKFAIVFKNKEQLVKVLSSKETDERLKNYDELCEGLGFGGDDLFNALFLSRLFYLANTDVELIGELDSGEEVND